MTRETLQIRAMKGNYDIAGTYLNLGGKLCRDHTIESTDKNGDILIFGALQAENNMQGKDICVWLLLAAFEDPECYDK